MLFLGGCGYFLLHLLHSITSRPRTQTENCSWNINASAFTFFFFDHYLRHHVREAAATLVHICLHLVFIECMVTVHTCISNLAVSWKFRHKTSCSFDFVVCHRSSCSQCLLCGPNAHVPYCWSDLRRPWQSKVNVAAGKLLLVKTKGGSLRARPCREVNCLPVCNIGPAGFQIRPIFNVKKHVDV